MQEYGIYECVNVELTMCNWWNYANISEKKEKAYGSEVDYIYICIVIISLIVFVYWQTKFESLFFHWPLKIAWAVVYMINVFYAHTDLTYWMAKWLVTQNILVSPIIMHNPAKTMLIVQNGGPTEFTMKCKWKRYWISKFALILLYT